MEDERVIKLLTNINDGFASIRQTITKEFAASNKEIAELSKALAVMDSRISNIISAQTALEVSVKETEYLKDEVEKNTEFRKKAEKINWEVTKYLIWAVVGALLFMVANFIVQNGFTTG